MSDKIDSDKYERHSHRGEDLENPPRGYRNGFSNLIWNLRAYGFPITLESVNLVRQYLQKQEIDAEDADYQVVAQSIAQNTDIDFDSNNAFETKEEQITFSYYSK
jgi:hypothetical protein